MTRMGDPIRWDGVIRRGTDHDWLIHRRLDGNGDPIIPTEAEAQFRGSYQGALWADATVTIDDVGGWVTVQLDEAATAGDEWDDRVSGVWDLEVVVDGKRLRWAEGRTTVSQDVTR